MNAATKKITDEIDSLLKLAKDCKERYEIAEKSNIGEKLYDDLFYFIARSVHIFLSLNKQASVKSCSTFKHYHITLNKFGNTFNEHLLAVTASLKSSKRELENGLLYKLSDLIKAEVFDDFMDYSKHLLDNGYKDAAAVMIGGVLEDKLRIECNKREIPIKDAKGKNLTINPMNENLCKAGVYDLLKQKQITVFAQIRNDAAHADYGKYTPNDVEDMYKYVMNLSF